MTEVEIAGGIRVRYSVEALSMMHRNMRGEMKQWMVRFPDMITIPRYFSSTRILSDAFP